MKMNQDTEALLPPALLAEVEAIAVREHRPILEIIQEAVGVYLEGHRRDIAVPADLAERARAFEIWAHNHPSTPPLSDEAVRRENLIRDDR